MDNQQDNINAQLMTLKFSELQKLGADCIADIDHVDILINMRHIYLDVAKDLFLRSNDEKNSDYQIGLLHCELAEKIQEMIDIALY